MGKTFLTIAVAVVVIYALLVASGKAKNPFAPSGARLGEANNDGDIKCELRDSNGRIITITGRGAEFEKLCRQQSPVTWYGYQYYPLYYYTWYNPFGWRRWPYGGHGVGGPGGPGSGTGGGTGPGTGGGGGPV